MDSSEQFDAALLTSLLARCDLFVGLQPDDLAGWSEGVSLLDFARGSLLIRQGDAADSVFVIVEGTAEVVLQLKDGGEELIDILSVGDCVGDLAILLDQPRTATVRAIRNCRAVRIDRASFLQLPAAASDFSLRLARTVAQRLERTTRERVRTRRVTDIVAIVRRTSRPIDRTMDRLAAALASPPAAARLHLVDLADHIRLRHHIAEADVVLIVADGREAAGARDIEPVFDMVRHLRPRPPVGLLLCHDGPIAAGGMLRWPQDLCTGGRYHARLDQDGDVGRIARLLTGTATGVALSGGGARGFAHIGVLQALKESGRVVDYVAGTSMGAIIAGQYAAGFTIDRMIAETRRAYVDQQGLPDFAFPTVSLYSGRATDRRLKAMFGECLIEDLPIPYFAVAADLRRAEAVVLEHGPLWRAARISCSVPGMLPPTEQDGRLLVDGGLLDNLPVEALRRRCGGHVIASDVSVAVEFDHAPPRRLWHRSQPERPSPGIAQIMMRTVQLASIRDSREAGTPADLYLNPQLNDVGMSDFSRLDEIVERGAVHARRMLKGPET